MYIDGFIDAEDILKQFEAPADALLDANLLYAKYKYESYEGSAFILFTKDDKMWEVHGSHCSCYGLEGQWDPQETSRDLLEARFFGKSDNFPYACETDEEKDLLRQAVLSEIVESIFLRN